jgi:predicted PurR-regulated permease PerM
MYLLGPQLADQISLMARDLPTAARALVEDLTARPWGRWIVSFLHRSTQGFPGVSLALWHIGGIVLSGANAITALLVIGLTTLYFVMEPTLYVQGARQLLPARYRQRFDTCVDHVTQRLRWCLLAKLISLGEADFYGERRAGRKLRALGVPLWGTLGLITAALTFIPNIGPILSAIPALLLAFTSSPLKGLLTIALYITAHFIEGNLVTPLAERRIANLAPPG